MELTRREAAAILGTDTDVHARWRNMATLLHPDRAINPAFATDAFQRAQAAYEVLVGKRTARPEPSADVWTPPRRPAPAPAPPTSGPRWSALLNELEACERERDEWRGKVHEMRAEVIVQRNARLRVLEELDAARSVIEIMVEAAA